MPSGNKETHVPDTLSPKQQSTINCGLDPKTKWTRGSFFHSLRNVKHCPLMAFQLRRAESKILILYFKDHKQEASRSQDAPSCWGPACLWAVMRQLSLFAQCLCQRSRNADLAPGYRKTSSKMTAVNPMPAGVCIQLGSVLSLLSVSTSVSRDTS